MNRNRNNQLLSKRLAIGLLIAGLSFYLHPGLGQSGLMINGEPVADPSARLAAIPTLLIVLVFTGLFAILAFWGVGMMLVLGALLFVVLGIFTIVPYLLPALAIIFVVLLMSLSREKQD